MRRDLLATLVLAACGGGKATSSELLCAGDAEYSLSASAVGLGELNGAMVWVSAVEPDDDPDTDDLVVLLTDTVSVGAFSVSCGDSLSENTAYPSAAIIIDANGDGVCSDGDRWVLHQLFGWASSQRYVVTSGDLAALRGDTIGEQHACDYFVPGGWR